MSRGWGQQRHAARLLSRDPTEPLLAMLVAEPPCAPSSPHLLTALVCCSARPLSLSCERICGITPSLPFQGLWEGTEISSCAQYATLYVSFFFKEKGCVGHLKTRVLAKTCVRAKPVLWAIARNICEALNTALRATDGMPA